MTRSIKNVSRKQIFPLLVCLAFSEADQKIKGRYGEDTVNITSASLVCFSGTMFPQALGDPALPQSVPTLH